VWTGRLREMPAREAVRLSSSPRRGRSFRRALRQPPKRHRSLRRHPYEAPFPAFPYRLLWESVGRSGSPTDRRDAEGVVVFFSRWLRGYGRPKTATRVFPRPGNERLPACVRCGALRGARARSLVSLTLRTRRAICTPEWISSSSVGLSAGHPSDQRCGEYSPRCLARRLRRADALEKRA